MFWTFGTVLSSVFLIKKNIDLHSWNKSLQNFKLYRCTDNIVQNPSDWHDIIVFAYNIIINITILYDRIPSLHRRGKFWRRKITLKKGFLSWKQCYITELKQDISEMDEHVVIVC